jgi:hypothetical protein
MAALSASGMAAGGGTSCETGLALPAESISLSGGVIKQASPEEINNEMKAAA